MRIELSYSEELLIDCLNRGYGGHLARRNEPHTTRHNKTLEQLVKQGYLERFHCEECNEEFAYRLTDEGEEHAKSTISQVRNIAKKAGLNVFN